MNIETVTLATSDVVGHETLEQFTDDVPRFPRYFELAERVTALETRSKEWKRELWPLMPHERELVAQTMAELGQIHQAHAATLRRWNERWKPRHDDPTPAA